MGTFIHKNACHPSNQVCHPERSDAQRRAVEGPAVRSRTPRLTFYLKTAQALALAIAVCFSLGATEPGKRFDDLSHRMMCTCGCAQILGECNHVGCPDSGRMRDELAAAIGGGAGSGPGGNPTGGDGGSGGPPSGLDDQHILNWFAAKYGAVVLAAPPASGFNLVAWIAPFAVFAAALLGTILLIRHWSAGRTEAVIDSADPEMSALRDRVRRETGEEGGY